MASTAVEMLFLNAKASPSLTRGVERRVFISQGQLLFLTFRVYLSLSHESPSLM